MSICTREISLEILNLIYNGITFDEALVKVENWSKLDARDKSFVKMIILTLIRRNIEIDLILSNYVKYIPRDFVTNILRIGITQILFLRIPEYSAVNISANLVKKRKKNLTNFVNAVLRQICRDKEKLISNLHIQKNIPQWIFSNWKKSFGIDLAQKFANQCLKEPYLDINIKKNEFSLKNWSNALNGKNLFGEIVRKKNTGSIEDLSNYSDGKWWIQSASASVPVNIICNYFEKINYCKTNILEVGAAPGGKTTQLCDNKFNVTALDISLKRIDRLKKNLKRVNYNAEILNIDINKWKTKRKFDCILIDAPCSATGIINKKPEILIHKKNLDLSNLQRKQKNILHSSSKLLSENGLIIYVVCSLIAEEGINQILNFLERNKEFKLLKLDNKLLNNIKVNINNGMAYITPICYELQGGMDGFFIACLIKQK